MTLMQAFLSIRRTLIPLHAVFIDFQAASMSVPSRGLSADKELKGTNDTTVAFAYTPVRSGGRYDRMKFFGNDSLLKSV